MFGCIYWLHGPVLANHPIIQPNIIQQNNAPTSAIDRPQISKVLKSFLVSVPSAVPAMYRAPTVDSDERSTRLALTAIDQAMGSGSIPPSCSASDGTIGRNAGSTT